MNILFVSDVLYPYTNGGVENIEYNEMAELAKRHRVSVASFDYRGKDALAPKGIRYIRVSRAKPAALYNARGSRSTYYSLKFAFSLPFRMPRGVDIIVANAFPYLHIPFLRAYCFLHRCKLLIDVAEVWGSEQWARYAGLLGPLGDIFAQRALRMGDAYIANSSTTRKGLERLGIPARKVHVFSPVMDDALIGSPKPMKKKARILYAGRLNDYKRLDKWLDVFSKVAATTDVTGTIVGDGPWKRYLQNKIRDMGLKGRVGIIPFYKDKRSLYRAIKESAVLLQMSEREGLSVVALESVALGTPVVLPSYTPIPEEVKALCTVADERKLPAVVAGKIRQRSSHRPRAPGARLRQYYIKNVNEEFSKIFNELGIG